jgi:hypothetical protein
MSSLSTDLLTASAVVSDHKDYLNAVVVNADGTNIATVIVYDNASAASGKVLAKVVVPASSRTQSIVFNRGVQSSNGLYISIAGIGAEAQVYYGAV